MIADLSLKTRRFHAKIALCLSATLILSGCSSYVQKGQYLGSGTGDEPWMISIRNAPPAKHEEIFWYTKKGDSWVYSKDGNGYTGLIANYKDREIRPWLSTDGSEATTDVLELGGVIGCGFSPVLMLLGDEDQACKSDFTTIDVSFSSAALSVALLPLSLTFGLGGIIYAKDIRLDRIHEAVESTDLITGLNLRLANYHHDAKSALSGTQAQRKAFIERHQNWDPLNYVAKVEHAYQAVRIEEERKQEEAAVAAEAERRRHAEERERKRRERQQALEARKAQYSSVSPSPRRKPTQPIKPAQPSLTDDAIKHVYVVCPVARGGIKTDYYCVQAYVRNDSSEGSVCVDQSGTKCWPWKRNLQRKDFPYSDGVCKAAKRRTGLNVQFARESTRDLSECLSFCEKRGAEIPGSTRCQGLLDR